MPATKTMGSLRTSAEWTQDTSSRVSAWRRPTTGGLSLAGLAALALTPLHSSKEVYNCLLNLVNFWDQVRELAQECGLTPRLLFTRKKSGRTWLLAARVWE